MTFPLIVTFVRLLTHVSNMYAPFNVPLQTKVCVLLSRIIYCFGYGMVLMTNGTQTIFMSICESMKYKYHVASQWGENVIIY